MPTPILATKLYLPPPRSKVVPRRRLFLQLDEGHAPGVMLISAPAGFGKTTLVSEWIAAGRRRAPPMRVAWLSLDEGDNDPARFLAYLVAALQTIGPGVGAGVLGVLEAPQAPPIEAILTALVNDVAALPDPFVLVLDDYHVIEAPSIGQALAFLIEHLPPRMRLVITTREDPDLPLARLRARGQLAELRAADLRFTAAEAADFLNRVMGLALSAEDIAALENRTEGWIAGLQLAAIALQRSGSQPGPAEVASFIQSFTGSHRFVMDYLVEEVLRRQPAHVETFLLRTSILDRLCGPLCDAVLGGRQPTTDDLEAVEANAVASRPSSAVLGELERANLFIVPLDSERRWYRYHHLFADLLRQRLPQSLAESGAEAHVRLNALHVRASQWYEDNGLEVEAFRHAAAAQDTERAARLVERGLPLHSRDAVAPVLRWLRSLPRAVLDARPTLWATHGSLLLVIGQTAGVEDKLQAAEAALRGAEPDEKTRYLIGQIAASRSVLALTRYDVGAMLAQSRRALEHLHPANVVSRSTALWTLGYAHFLQGDRAAAGRAHSEAIALSEAAGRTFTLILATIGLGNVQEAENQLHEAGATYRRVLQLAGEQPLQIVHEAHLGLGRVLYEWNDLEAAAQHGRASLPLARQYESHIDRFVLCEVFLARLKLAQGDAAGAAAMLAETERAARQRGFAHRLPEVAAAQVLVLLRLGQAAAAAEKAQAHDLPLSQARVRLAQSDPAAALQALEPWRRKVAARGWPDETLKLQVLQAVAFQALGEQAQALQALGEALAPAEPGGFVRLFVDEGPPMAELLQTAAARGLRPGYVDKLLAAFGAEPGQRAGQPQPPAAQPLVEPLSPRELEVLRLIAQGLSNQEIGERLFLALDTVKGHNRRIYDKLQVQRRTEAVARARELGLL